MKKKPERVSREVFSTLRRPHKVVSSPFANFRSFLHPSVKPQGAFTVTVAKKDIPTAVKRNAIKRRYTQIIRSDLTSRQFPQILQCLPKKTALSASFKELTDDVKHSIDILIS